LARGAQRSRWAGPKGGGYYLGGGLAGRDYRLHAIQRGSVQYLTGWRRIGLAASRLGVGPGPLSHGPVINVRRGDLDPAAKVGGDFKARPGGIA
jgi:hypothetical protein